VHYGGFNISEFETNFMFIEKVWEIDLLSVDIDKLYIMSGFVLYRL